jgi:hypothetical protein
VLGLKFCWYLGTYLASPEVTLLDADLAMSTTAVCFALLLAQGLALGHEKALASMIAELTALVQLAAKPPEEVFQPLAGLAFWARHPSVTPSLFQFDNLTYSEVGFL